MVRGTPCVDYVGPSDLIKQFLSLVKQYWKAINEFITNAVSEYLKPKPNYNWIVPIKKSAINQVFNRKPMMIRARNAL